ncbi:MAG: malate dehydrogenase (quinone) [Methylobacillus sp.]|jgi:malate dehydrogenase (quinone)|nr:malate dehydrogenase (quinone) [Methylobacillus sp.]
MPEHQTDILLVGGGVMSATLGTLLARLDPALGITLVERLESVALESSDGWNNAGTGHAGYCELNYTPQQPDGSVAIARALGINAAFEVSLQLWAALVEQGALPAPSQFINAVPHVSFVWGEADVAFLRERHAKLAAHHLFADMEYSEDASVLQTWMPLVMQGRAANQRVAATRVSYGADVDFGALTRLMVEDLQRRANFSLKLKQTVEQLRQLPDGRWRVTLSGGEILTARFVFLGAGGGTLPLLQKSGIAESRGYGGFPVSGQWLVCNNSGIAKQHHAKVYGKAPLGAPPMSVPHLDTRVIGGKSAMLFGPYASFTTKFLKRGSFLDLIASVKPGNLASMFSAGCGNMNLTRYLIGEAMQSHHERMAALRRYFPDAQDAEWTLANAGQRVQIIKNGKLEFGTEIVTSRDGTLAALLGASPGASTSAQAMMDVVQRCFAANMQSAEWQTRMKTLIPSWGKSLVENAEALRETRPRVLEMLGLE